MKKTNRDIILTVIVIALIGWLVLRYFITESPPQPVKPAAPTEKPMKK